MDDIAHIDMFVTTKSGTRAYEWELEDGDRLTVRYDTQPTQNWVAQRMHVNSNWLKLITGPEAGTMFHKPNSIAKDIHSLMEVKR